MSTSAGKQVSSRVGNHPGYFRMHSIEVLLYSISFPGR